MTKIEKMIAFGGKEWSGKRVYFNGEVADKAIGLEYMVYGRKSAKGTNCKSSWLNGEEVSNNSAFKIREDFYYDIESEKFVGVDESLIVVNFSE